MMMTLNRDSLFSLTWLYYIFISQNSALSFCKEGRFLHLPFPSFSLSRPCLFYISVSIFLPFWFKSSKDPQKGLSVATVVAKNSSCMPVWYPLFCVCVPDWQLFFIWSNEPKEKRERKGKISFSHFPSSFSHFVWEETGSNVRRWCIWPVVLRRERVDKRLVTGRHTPFPQAIGMLWDCTIKADSQTTDNW